MRLDDIDDWALDRMLEQNPNKAGHQILYNNEVLTIGADYGQIFRWACRMNKFEENIVTTCGRVLPNGSFENLTLKNKTTL